MKNAIAIAVVAGLAAAASAQDFEISMVAPESVATNSTYTVEVWGTVSGGSWVDGVSAMAGFGIDAIATEGASLVTANGGSVLSGWASGFGTDGTVNGADLEGTSGGQLANLFGILNPGIDMNNPILLFTFDVSVGAAGGSVTYTPANPNVNGGLSYYPDSEDGASVIAPNDSGTTLSLVGATTRVVPAPASLALLGLGGLVARRRRH
jgi:MYXO-CTERM domain-containing protein